ncbi:MAG: hypothetical protein EOO43_17270 [Flavobacterium sp.]|nr:MAG: hypothetical protein EOO43_17270 [Flavobacterium sp.]
MNQDKFEHFIEKLLVDLPQLSKAPELDVKILLALIKDFETILKNEEDKYFDTDNLTAKEFLLFAFGKLVSTDVEKKEIEEMFRHIANGIRYRKGIPIELTLEEIEEERLFQEALDDERRELYRQEEKNFDNFLNRNYNDNFDPDQQHESFW